MRHKPDPEQLKQLYLQGRFDEIVRNAKAFSKANPKNHVVFTILGVAFAKSGLTKSSVECFRRVVRLCPDSAEAFNNLGNALRSQGQHKDALLAFDQAIQLKPDYAQAHNGRASTLSDLDNFEECIKSFEKVLELDPKHVMAMDNLGQAYQNLGDFSKAENMYRLAIEIEPGYAEAHYHLSQVHRYTVEDGHFEQMQARFRENHPDIKEKVFLNFALGKACADIRDYDRAFEHWAAGNSAFKMKIGYHPEKDEVIFQRIRGWSEKLPKLDHEDISELKPVFILGMPRSGTSLVEQILSGHSRVHAAGELVHLARGVDKFCADKDHLTRQMLKNIRSYYRQNISGMGQGKQFITDKTPLNSRWIGLIRTIFPDARIIHLKRHPMAVCFSNFRYFFQSEGMSYSNSLDDIGRYYLQYDKLMEFWYEKYPGDIITVDYARLTENPRGEIENLLSRLDLEWQESCLEIEKNQRAVTTVSNTQIRSKIYAKSSEEWRHYEAHLAPLKKMLDPILKRQGWE